MSDALTQTPAPRVRTIDARKRRGYTLPVSAAELWVTVGGCALALVVGLALGSWLELPFGSMG